MKTITATPDMIQRKWYVIDADGLVLGRLATEVARRLRGKHKPMYTPSMDTGDFIVVVNAGKVRLTGKKLQQKVYNNHSGYQGGLKSVTAGKILGGRFPERVLENAVRGMLPKGPMGREMFRKLRLYSGAEHPHAGQNPESLKLS
ncbi:MAG: 50S ribosomal protein L13 [Magnetococcus sp. WYHC-3]